MIICVAGKSGSGKSEFARRLVAKDSKFVHYDLDLLCHELYKEEKIKAKVRDAFGDSIFVDGEINRKALGKLVFNDSVMMMRLTDIIWKELIIYLDNEMSQNPDKWYVFDAIKIDQIKYFDMSEFRILLDIPVEIRKKRVMERDNIDAVKFEVLDRHSHNYDNVRFNVIIESEDIDSEISRIYETILSL